MSLNSSVLNSVARPITRAEFRDALFATCKPRFAAVRFARPRPIGLAVSGGVDSMALAFLLSEHVKAYKAQPIADSPVHKIFAVTVDHGLRDESAAEAKEVVAALKLIGVSSTVLALDWTTVLKPGVKPSTQPNVESLARSLRYRTVGSYYARVGVVSLFLAHHSDDQYETILMRLLSGHKYRGLLGMNRADAIPECHDMDCAYMSGLVDDQWRKEPFLRFQPSCRARKALRSSLLLQSTLSSGVNHLHCHLGVNDIAAHLPWPVQNHSGARAPYLAPLDIEDGGIMIYRPLLGFDKARLIATCEANGVPWFEDSTNQDPTLTKRNAIRKMCRDHQLPKALQKPTILALADGLRQKVRQEEAEGVRILVQQACLIDFDPNVGTLLVDMPRLSIGRRSRGYCGQRRAELKRARQRVTAAVITRKLIDFVTPDKRVPPISCLDNTICRLFPYLYDDKSSLVSEKERNKAFGIAGVLFEPRPSRNSKRWLLSRTPFPSNVLQELKANPTWSRWAISTDPPLPYVPRDGVWKTWSTKQLWDGRFWIRLSSRDRQSEPVLLPLMATHLKAFKASLTPEDRDRLEKLLKRHAPGKIRYTLPGVYVINKQTGFRENFGKMLNELTLVSLPTLGINVPGLEVTVRYDVRYKHVDAKLLARRRRAGMHLPRLLSAYVSSSRSKRLDRLKASKRRRLKTMYIKLDE